MTGLIQSECTHSIEACTHLNENKVQLVDVRLLFAERHLV